jgi:hypothetical protein
MNMTSDRPGVTESGVNVPAGTVVEYIRHALGGHARVMIADKIEVMPAACFKALR